MARASAVAVPRFIGCVTIRIGQLIADQLAMAPVGHNHDVHRINQSGEPSAGVLQERAAVGQRRERHGFLGATQGSQPRTAAAGEYHGIHRPEGYPR